MAHFPRYQITGLLCLLCAPAFAVLRPANGCNVTRPQVIHIPKTGGTTATQRIKYQLSANQTSIAPRLPVLLKEPCNSRPASCTCNWHHIPPRYFLALDQMNEGEAFSPYAGRRTVCFVRDPVSRWISEVAFRHRRNGPLDRTELNRWTRNLLEDVLTLGNDSSSKSGAAFLPTTYVIEDPSHAPWLRVGKVNASTISYDPMFDCHLIPQYVYVFADEQGEHRLCHEIYSTRNMSQELTRLEAEYTCRQQAATSSTAGVVSNDMVRKGNYSLSAVDLEPDLLKAIQKLYAKDYLLLGAFF